HGLDYDPLGAPHIGVDPGKREAALLAHLLTALLDDDGVEIRSPTDPPALVDDEHPELDAHLDRRETDAHLGVHRLHHVVQPAFDLGRHLTDRRRLAPQDRVAVEPHFQDRHGVFLLPVWHCTAPHGSSTGSMSTVSRAPPSRRRPRSGPRTSATVAGSSGPPRSTTWLRPPTSGAGPSTVAPAACPRAARSWARLSVSRPSTRRWAIRRAGG